MCLNLRYITNPTKVISLEHRQRLFVPCKCGYCSECQSDKMSEWYYRIYHEWLDTTKYVFFTTLTYDPEHLPHLSDFLPLDDDDSLPDYSCFSRLDIRSFFTTLNSRIARNYGRHVAKNVRHFLSAEYGADDRYTHRPHYHVLFFVNADGITVDQLKQEIDASWLRGYTDKVRLVGDHANYFRCDDCPDTSRRSVSRYVSKYVQKSSLFSHRISERVAALLSAKLDDFASDYRFKTYTSIDNETLVNSIEFRRDSSVMDSYVFSVGFSRYRSSLKRCVEQFHCQSEGFGQGALNRIDVDSLIECGYLVMPDSLHFVRKVSLPLYYARKLFYELVEWHGRKFWSLTPLGMKWRNRQLSRVVDHLTDKFAAAIAQYKLPSVDSRKLACYVVYFKGRYKFGSLGNEPSFRDLINSPRKLFRYGTMSDRQVFHSDFITDQFQGFVQSGLKSLRRCISSRSWFRDNVIDDTFRPEFSGFDCLLDKIDAALCGSNPNRQELFDVRQEREGTLRFVFAR